MNPTFLIIGSQKAGTTSLYRVLRDHPQVYVSPVKEINYFFHNAIYERGLDFYESHFNGAPANAQAIGEASPGYICHPQASSRIHRTYPDLKLILTVRDPVDRAYSQYWDSRRKLAETRSFPQAMKEALTPIYVPGETGYFSRGTYAIYVRRYLEHFRRDQLRVLRFRDLKENPKRFYQQCFQFLDVGLSFSGTTMVQAANTPVIWSHPLYHFFFWHPRYAVKLPRRMRDWLCTGKRIPFTYPPMPPRVRNELQNFYRPYNADLEALTGLDLSHWETV
jgi:hypothetical protein